ncbi:predicted protein [Lichtheimia corymbifera JMRC:FSU:9682]|uniref:F-box domain-containing protein n=1 Tax=Lichtheimia corymbifera JMRC:FSU:9682 TaxID=1263082 RepID=A0A068RSA5_9FUNG|nr:predicted protein [Lichtheimia corymbifera JMRC:FSU:9682]
MLHTIAREVLYIICSFLSGKDTINLAKCNHALQVALGDEYVWAQMTKTRFPKLYKETLLLDDVPRNWRKLYMENDQLRMSVAKQMAITHVRLPYWQRLESKESMYEATARLHSVCWFDVNGILQGVPQGSYRVQWRMRVSLSARWNEPLDFTVSVMEANGLTHAYTTPDDFYIREDILTNTWILVTLPGEIHVKEWFSNVRVSHEKKTNHWKSGIELDWVKLLPSHEAPSPGLTVEYESRYPFYWRHRSRSLRDLSLASSDDPIEEYSVFNDPSLLEPSLY